MRLLVLIIVLFAHNSYGAPNKTKADLLTEGIKHCVTLQKNCLDGGQLKA